MTKLLSTLLTGEELMLTKEQVSGGLTRKLSKGTVVRVEGWVNKHGTNILFVATSTGVYKIKGDVDAKSGKNV
jgi:hypothetical protein